MKLTATEILQIEVNDTTLFGAGFLDRYPFATFSFVGYIPSVPLVRAPGLNPFPP